MITTSLVEHCQATGRRFAVGVIAVSLLAVGCGQSGGEIALDPLEKLTELQSTQSIETQIESILDAGPNVTRRYRDGTTAGPESQALVIGRVTGGRGLYGLEHRQDPATEEFQTFQVEYGSAGTVPVMELDLEVIEVLSSTPEFSETLGVATGETLSFQWGLTPADSDVDAIVAGFRGYGTVVAYFGYGQRDFADGTTDRYVEVSLLGGAIGVISDDGAVHFPVLETWDGEFAHLELTIDDIRQSSGTAREVAVDPEIATSAAQPAGE